ncbi:SPOR domain-containing protein [Thauera sp.]|uniref:SPOR domain-containing protein n=1 Tax=Thauera sp. TaxID=1905334 RepID=UPI00257CB3C6|nr:SPOR domain-containing protein [Thauera sp.]
MSDAENLEIKKRARRRLVGAVALALLAAIVLPMMMDQEPRPTNADIQITIPDRDPAQARPIAAAPDAAAAPVLPPPPEEEEPTTVPAPREAEPPKAPVVAPAPARPEPKRAEPPSQPLAPPSATKPPAESAEAVRARAALEGREVPARGESFVLQIGAFSDAAKAARITADLKKQGFPAYTEQAGNVTRVRVGPVAGRTAADKTAAQLKTLGFSTVVTPR